MTTFDAAHWRRVRAIRGERWHRLPPHIRQIVARVMLQMTLRAFQPKR